MLRALSSSEASALKIWQIAPKPLLFQVQLWSLWIWFLGIRLKWWTPCSWCFFSVQRWSCLRCLLPGEEGTPRKMQKKEEEGRRRNEENERLKMKEEGLMKNSNGVMGDVIFCKQGHCTGNGRKLLTATTTTSSTSSKTEDSGDNKANPTSRVKPVNGEKQEKIPTTSQQQDQYADIMEIAEMDYSSANRKPPIHN